MKLPRKTTTVTQWVIYNTITQWFLTSFENRACGFDDECESIIDALKFNDFDSAAAYLSGSIDYVHCFEIVEMVTTAQLPG